MITCSRKQALLQAFSTRTDRLFSATESYEAIRRDSCDGTECVSARDAYEIEQAETTQAYDRYAEHSKQHG